MKKRSTYDKKCFIYSYSALKKLILFSLNFNHILIHFYNFLSIKGDIDLFNEYLLFNILKFKMNYNNKNYELISILYSGKSHLHINL